MCLADRRRVLFVPLWLLAGLDRVEVVCFSADYHEAVNDSVFIKHVDCPSLSKAQLSFVSLSSLLDMNQRLFNIVCG